MMGFLPLRCFVIASVNASLNGAKLSGLIVRPAAIAWPPNFSMSSGLSRSTRSSKSLIWTSGIERIEPFKTPSALAKTAEGHW